MNFKWLELAGWCALIWGVVYSVPGAYRVETEFEIKGSFDSLEAIPDWVDRRARELASDTGLLDSSSGIRICTSDQNAARVRCALTVERRSLAKKWSLFLSKDLPDQVGWINPSVLLQRIREKKAETDRTRLELASVQDDLAQISKETEEIAADVDAQRNKKEQGEKDLVNRRRQLEILSDAITANRDGTRAQLFEQKRDEVRRRIEELKARISNQEQRIADMAKPLEPRDALRAGRDQLKERIEKLDRQIGAFENLYVSRSGEGRIPDPEHFQISPLAGAETARPIRSAGAWFYAWLAGFLVFLLRHRNDPNVLRPKTYWSPRQVELDTGMAFLGTLPPDSTG
ncbi:MAG: hypothetical protein V1798_04720 [Pseudomonadota bacterium]